jgi:hypothetical protein
MDNWSRLEVVPRDCGHPARNGSSARSSGRSSGRATAGTRSSWNTTPCDLGSARRHEASPPNRRRRPKTPTWPASGRCKRRSRAPRRSRRSGSGQGRSAADYSPDDDDASPAIPRLRCKSRGPRRRVARQPTPSVARVHTLSVRSLRMTSDGSGAPSWSVAVIVSTAPRGEKPPRPRALPYWYPRWADARSASRAGRPWHVPRSVTEPTMVLAVRARADREPRCADSASQSDRRWEWTPLT